MRRVNILILGCLLLCCACHSTPTSFPTATVIPTLFETSSPEILIVSTPYSTSTPRGVESMWIDFIMPMSGDIVSNPIRFRVRTNMVPSNPTINIRLYDQNWNLLAETMVTLPGEIGKAGTVSSELPVSDYTGAAILVANSEESGVSISARVTIKKP